LYLALGRIYSRNTCKTGAVGPLGGCMTNAWRRRPEVKGAVTLYGQMPFSSRLRASPRKVARSTVK
jgi:hypothetical protein